MSKHPLSSQTNFIIVAGSHRTPFVSPGDDSSMSPEPGKKYFTPPYPHVMSLDALVGSHSKSGRISKTFARAQWTRRYPSKNGVRNLGGHKRLLLFNRRLSSLDLATPLPTPHIALRLEQKTSPWFSLAREANRRQTQFVHPSTLLTKQKQNAAHVSDHEVGHGDILPILTGLEKKQRQNERQGEQRPLTPRQLRQRLFPHATEGHLYLQPR